jgi:hypothetical protein
VKLLREHRFAVGFVLFAACVALLCAVLLSVIRDNARQDNVDRTRTDQVDAIVADIADVVIRLEEERRVSCSYGNELRSDIRDFINALATNQEAVERANEEFAERPCPPIQTLTPPTTEEP